MSEKEQEFKVTDRRLFSADGEIRPDAVLRNEAEREASKERANQEPAPPLKSEQPAATRADAQPKEPEHEASLPEGPTAEETAESHAAYRETTKQLDDLLRSKTPGAAPLGAATFEHVVQSIYMTAMMQLGAATPPGEKPRIDLMGARQTVDMLGILADKTKGNLTTDEQRLLESALFELRMMFLEITNAIAQNAAKPSQAQQKH